ncbi:MAG: glycerate kinase [Chloroflexi bacterium]|nr:glycerate kinase [Chloroflexota bacterium]
MRVLIAPQAFKGSLSAAEAASAMAAGLPQGVSAELLPVADGGEGTVDALLAALGGSRVSTPVRGPMGSAVTAAWGLLPDGRAVIEMAAASGLPLVRPDERDPRRATTYGTGELIAAALEAGAREVIVGIGGSATNDGGAGALAALGARLLDSAGKELPLVVIHLQRLARLDLAGLHSGLASARLRVICDVTNPLLGPSGATAVYGPQKGVNGAMQPVLEKSLAHWAHVVETTVGRSLREVPGAGAAGGLGFGLLALGASLEPGAELVLDLARFDARAAEAHLVLTGEGMLDGQSLFGKSTVAVARRAKRAGVPVLALVGGLGPGYQAAYEEGISAIMPIVPGPMPLEEAQARAAELVREATGRAFRMIGLGDLHAPRPRRQ